MGSLGCSALWYDAHDAVKADSPIHPAVSRRRQGGDAPDGVARAFRREIAPHQRHLGHAHGAEARGRRLRQRAAQRRPGLVTPAPLVEDATDRDMRMPGALLPGEAALREGIGHTGLQRPRLQRALGHADPEDAGALEAREGADAVERDVERAAAGPRLVQRGSGLGQTVLGLVAEELQGDVEVLRRHPGHRGPERPERLDGGRDALAQVVGKEDRDERADHAGDDSARRSRSSAACEDCHFTASRPPGKRNRRTSMRGPSDPGTAAAMYTVPTGFAGVPPSGPAMPVTAIPHGEPDMRQMPAAIASATGALTAPCSRSIASGTPSSCCLASFEYTTTPRST